VGTVRKRIAIVGGGIAGLAAAVRVRDRAPRDTEIIVYEQTGVLGGKLRTGELAGVAVERGAESFLVAAPDGTDSAALRLTRRLGLGDALVHPSAGTAALAFDGRLEPIPPGTLMGVPRESAGPDPDEGRPLLGPDDDVAVGELVRARYGDAAVDRLVDPMLGGVYAGHADQLSLVTTMPALAVAARTEHTLAAAVRAAQAATVRVPGRPVFATVDGGLTRLVAAAAAAAGARISLGLPVRDLARTAHGWRLLLGPAASPPGFTAPSVVARGTAPQTDDVDAVVLAVPAKAAGRLLHGVDAGAAEAIATLDYASVALAGLALPPGTPLPDLSGFLVPPAEQTLVKAATFVTRKWAHLRRDGGPVIVRASLGRAGEQARLQLDDATLTALAHGELGRLIGAPLPPPVASWVQRWGGGLPQYRPGHAGRVAAARAALGVLPGLALAGAAYDGVGIPACVASGETAAEDVCKTLEDRP
jgi:oxygen-dependent protoporphyrinogen oxidase